MYRSRGTFAILSWRSLVYFYSFPDFDFKFFCGIFVRDDYDGESLLLELSSLKVSLPIARLISSFKESQLKAAEERK
jgi:hypothetical protein